jgi:outer membrane protein assembly factor BamB
MKRSILLLALAAVAADWPNYRGPDHNGTASETGLGTNPKQLWQATLGPGASSVTVSGGRVFTMGNVNGQDIVYCLDAATGREVWRHSYACALEKRSFEGGPAATPMVDDGKVYTLSHRGDLHCLDAATGKPVWSKNLVSDFKGGRPQWGFASSPAVLGDLLILDVGGDGSSTVALDKKDGKLRWQAGDETAGYATPVPAEFGGQAAVVLFKGRAVVGRALTDGRELWRLKWQTSYDVNAASPIVRGNEVFVSSGYNIGSALLRVAGGGVTEVWRNKHLCNQVNSSVLVGENLFGISGNVSPKAPLNCVEWKTGELKWSADHKGGGSLTAADGKLFVLSEKGELIMAEATAAAYRELSRTVVLKERCWVAPVVSGGRVYCRGNAGTLVCLSLGK